MHGVCRRHRFVVHSSKLSIVFATATWSQDAEEQTEAEETEVPAAEDVDSEAEDIDETGLDDENYADIEDDDFRPSEDIPADQSIPFPTDI